MKSNIPLVSAIIPVYNGEAFLAQAVDSVLSQTYQRVECIIVDDGSTDNTPSIVGTFGDRVRYIRKPNGGVASARNFGVGVSSGEYIAFLDADDMWLPTMLEREVELLLRNPKLGLVYAGLYLVDGKLNRIGKMMPPNGRMALRNSLLLELPIMTAITTGTLPVKVFHAVGGFDEHLSTSADTDFACRIASEYPVEGINEPLALYRQHGGQMHLNAGAMEHDMLIILEKSFGSDRLPAEISRLRNRAYTNLYMILAASYYKEREPRKAVSRLLLAVRYHPARAATLLWRRLIKGSGQLTAPETL